MNNPTIHIVCFDIPYPANYGGAIDVFYRLRWLKKKGIQVILHCTYKGELHHYAALEDLCKKVYYYKRNTSIFAQLSYKPYTVISRKSSQLINNLLLDDYPIVFEGLVSTYYMNSKLLKNRTLIFRECNVEHDYFRAIGKNSTTWWQRLFYKIEATKLQQYESQIQYANAILAVAHQDEEHYKQLYPDTPCYYLPSFHAFDQLNSSLGQSDYILYHANLGLAENNAAATYLLNNIVPQLPQTKFIFAGREPKDSLRQHIEQLPNASLIANPTDEELNRLICNAQINLLITNQPTGLKLKLLHVAYAGRHIVVNSPMVCGTELAQLCNVANTDDEIINLCQQLLQQPFTDEHLSKRKFLLDELFSNENKINKFINIISNHEKDFIVPNVHS